MTKKKIAFFINSMAAGGAEKVVSLLISNLQHEFDIHLILLNRTMEVGFDQTAATIYAFNNNPVNNTGGIIDVVKMPMIARRLKKYLNEQGIVHCISFLSRPNFITALARRMGWQGKVILCERVHTSSYYNSQTLAGKVGQWLVRNLYNHCDLLVVNAEGMAVDLRTTFKVQKPIRVVYNAIDLVASKQRAAVFVSDYAFTEFTFVLPGRFHAQKNHALLLAAVQQIAHLPFKVLLIGQGQLEDSLREKVVAMGLQHKIIFIGFRENPLPYIAKSDCLVMTSDYEGFPNVLLEALACGTPIISTDCRTGPRELLGGTFKEEVATGIEQLPFGILVPVNDKNELAKAMQTVMENPALLAHYKESAQKRINDFDVPNILGQFKAVITEVQ